MFLTIFLANYLPFDVLILSVKHINAKVCFSTLYLLKTYQDTFFCCCCQTDAFSKHLMRWVDCRVFFYLLRYMHVTVPPLTISVTILSVLFPKEKGLRVSFFQVFLKFRVRCNFDFSFFPYLFLECMSLKLPSWNKILFKKQ